VAAELSSLGAREWQIGLVAPLITHAFLNPQPLPEKEPKGAATAE
jgi:ribonuclease D